MRNMEKRKYVKPLLNSETFVTDKYVAACYLVNCNVDSFYELWDESNGETGLQRTGNNTDTQLLIAGGYYNSLKGCDKWHKGVTIDPEYNGYICGRNGNNVERVFWWKENLGSAYDYHASYINTNDYASNPNAS